MYLNVGTYITVVKCRLLVYHTDIVTFYVSQLFLLLIQQRSTANTSTYQIGYLPKQQIAHFNTIVSLCLNQWNFMQPTLIRGREKLCVGLARRNNSSLES